MKTHLLYHIYLNKDTQSVVEWNLKQLSKYTSIFTGHKIAVVAYDQIDWLNLFPEKCTKLFDKIISMPNDFKEREAATFPFLMHELGLKQVGYEDLIFFAHSKGAARISEDKWKQEAIKLWTQAMYDYCLKEVPCLTADQVCAGCFRRDNPPIMDRFTGYRWHFSGTFFWFKYKEFINKQYHGYIMPHRLGIECLPGRMFPIEQSLCIFGDNAPDMYNLVNVKQLLDIPIDEDDYLQPKIHRVRRIYNEKKHRNKRTRI